MEKMKLCAIFLFLLAYFPPSLASLPSCYLEEQMCGLGKPSIFETSLGTWFSGSLSPLDSALEQRNILNYTQADSPANCREDCQNTAHCTTCTYFGPDSSPFQNTCLLLSSCLETFPCEGCVTESVESCLCSLPHECYSDFGDILGFVEGVQVEDYCQRLCYDTRNCSTYTYYDERHTESPRLCVLHNNATRGGCQKISPEPCEGCHTGPRTCAKSEDEECNFAVWSSSMETGVTITQRETTLHLMSGEPNCYRSVKGLAVGGGGRTIGYSGGGGGSGLVVFEYFDVTAHEDIYVTVGEGGFVDTAATSSVVTVNRDPQPLIQAEGGKSNELFNGGDGYSGGGSQGARGGQNGGNGIDLENGTGGKGSKFNLTVNANLTIDLKPGIGGLGNITTGGGGGGGVVVNENSPEFNEYQGQGYGGGAGGSGETSGLPGCVVLEL